MPGYGLKIFRLADMEIRINWPPLHPWCRSTCIPYFEGNVKERFARDPEDGKGYYVPGDMKYKDWYKEHVEGKYGKDEAETIRKKKQNEGIDLEQYEKYKQVLGKEIPNSFDKFQELKYNKFKEWEEIKTLYRDVNWQLKAQNNIIKGDVHKVPFKAEPNSVFDNYKDGKLESRRYFGRTGKPRLDIDLTDHNNPKTHKIVPHAHNWNFKDEPYAGVSIDLQGREKPGRKLTKAEVIANKEIIK